MAITKSDIRDNLSKRLFFSKKECASIVDKFFEIIKKSLADGNEVKLSGFGVFTIKHKKARRGRNPHTGKEMEIKERKVLVFRSSKVANEKISRQHSANGDLPSIPKKSL